MLILRCTPMILLFVKNVGHLLLIYYSTKKAPEGNSSLQALFFGYELKMIVRSLNASYS